MVPTTSIKGKVICADRQGNVYKSLYIYDGDGAIELKLYNGLYLDYLLDLDNMKSQWVYVRLDGLYLGNYRMMLSIGGAPSDGINTAGTHKYYANSNLDNPRVAKLNVFAGEYVPLEASDILEVDASNYTSLGEDQLGRLVRFKGIKVRYAGYPNQDGVTNPPLKSGTSSSSSENPYPSWIVTDWGTPRFGAWYRWAYNRDNVRLYASVLISYNDAATSTAEAGIYGVRTSGYSQFAMKPIPKDGAVGDVLGIYGVYGTQWNYAQYQISVSRIEDLAFKTEDLLTEAQIERMTPASLRSSREERRRRLYGRMIPSRILKKTAVLQLRRTAVFSCRYGWRLSACAICRRSGSSRRPGRAASCRSARRVRGCGDSPWWAPRGIARSGARATGW